MAANRFPNEHEPALFPHGKTFHLRTDTFWIACNRFWSGCKCAGICMGANQGWPDEFFLHHNTGASPAWRNIIQGSSKKAIGFNRCFG